ncbi:anti-sigma factor family protein [Peribacillus sp. JNUCC 23]|uniref:anti-sigma factor family protein n=1 Tax=Peribacillus sp. NPDC096379 TaxID=3364393 RepID=UPI00381D934E
MKHITDEQLIAYIQNELSGKEIENLENHLTGCSQCQKEFVVLEELTNEWNEPSLQLSVDVTLDVMGVIEKTEKQKSARKNKRNTYLHFILAVAATILFSQLKIVDYIIDTSNHVVGISSVTVEQANHSLEKGMSSLNKINLKIQSKTGGENK